MWAMSVNWSAIFKQYRGQWVALSDDEQQVISAAPTAKEALELARRKGSLKPILTRLPQELVNYVG
jgi:hypothetical protein